MAWQQLTVRVPREHVPELETLLELAGAASITYEDASSAPLLEPAPGQTPLWPVVLMKALFAEDTDTTRVLALVDGTAGGGANASVARVDDPDTAPARQPFAPLRVGPRLWLISADDDAPPGEAAVLRLHRGLAFGTGEHPTTALCLRWIESSLAPGSIVLDYGCGSGVLALAALRLGAARAFAVDDDPQALAATERNATLNGLADRLWTGAPERLPTFRADVVLANILARPLIELAGPLAERVVSGGYAVLSGVLAEQADEVRAAYAPRFAIIETLGQDGWVRIVAQRHPRSG